MNNKEKDIINNLPCNVQELATDMIAAVKDKDAKKYTESASIFDVVFNRKQFDCSVMQSFARFILPKALEAGIIQQPQQPAKTDTNPNIAAPKAVGKAEVKAAESKKKAK